MFVVPLAVSVFSISALFLSKLLLRPFKSVILHGLQYHFSIFLPLFTPFCFHLFLAFTISFKHVYGCNKCDNYSWRQPRQLHSVFPFHAERWIREMVPQTPCQGEGVSSFSFTLICSCPKVPSSELVIMISNKVARQKERLKTSMSLGSRNVVLYYMGTDEA